MEECLFLRALDDIVNGKKDNQNLHMIFFGSEEGMQQFINNFVHFLNTTTDPKQILDCIFGNLHIGWTMKELYDKETQKLEKMLGE